MRYQFLISSDLNARSKAEYVSINNVEKKSQNAAGWVIPCIFHFCFCDSFFSVCSFHCLLHIACFVTCKVSQQFGTIGQTPGNEAWE